VDVKQEGSSGLEQVMAAGWMVRWTARTRQTAGVDWRLWRGCETTISKTIPLSNTSKPQRKKTVEHFHFWGVRMLDFAKAFTGFVH
jgi:hypothetical protein